MIRNVEVPQEQNITALNTSKSRVRYVRNQDRLVLSVCKFKGNNVSASVFCIFFTMNVNFNFQLKYIIQVLPVCMN